MRILDNDPQGSNGGTLFEFDNGIQARLVDILEGKSDPSIAIWAKIIIDNVLTSEEAYHRWYRSKKT
jgi:hypothetical protein